MGQNNSLQSIERIAESSLTQINEKLGKFDWNKQWQNGYPKTERAKQEMDNLKKPDVKEALREAFSEQTLVLTKLNEVF